MTVKTYAIKPSKTSEPRLLWMRKVAIRTIRRYHNLIITCRFVLMTNCFVYINRSILARLILALL